MDKLYGVYVVFVFLYDLFCLYLVLAHGNTHENTASTFHLKIEISDGLFDSAVWVSINTIKPICCETFKIPG